MTYLGVELKNAENCYEIDVTIKDKGNHDIYGQNFIWFGTELKTYTILENNSQEQYQTIVFNDPSKWNNVANEVLKYPNSVGSYDEETTKSRDEGRAKNYTLKVSNGKNKSTDLNKITASVDIISITYKYK